MNEARSPLEVADIAMILKALPHRYPFLMVDRVISTCAATSSASASRTSPSTSRSFSAIFPASRSFPAC